jgi:hypothetical protein
MCTANCPSTEVSTARQKTECGGRVSARLCSGCACERKKKRPAVTRPDAVICTSPFFSPEEGGEEERSEEGGYYADRVNCTCV